MARGAVVCENFLAAISRRRIVGIARQGHDVFSHIGHLLGFQHTQLAKCRHLTIAGVRIVGPNAVVDGLVNCLKRAPPQPRVVA